MSSFVYCAACLGEVAGTVSGGKEGELAYHAKCLRALFGTSGMPRLDLDTSEVLAAATEMAGKMSMSGYQQKISMALSADGKSLVAAPRGGRFILKPQIATPEVPENEHVTMQMGKLVGLDIPPCAMVRLRDGAMAYIVRRFDRLEEGTKLHVEDFCQLAELPPAEKYGQTAELCVRLTRQFATEQVIAVYTLFKIILFSYSVGNGDLHLKNLSLLRGREGGRAISPAYDLLNTELAIGDQKFALTVGGGDGRLGRKKWEEFAAYGRIPVKAANLAIGRQIEVREEMAVLIGHSFLSKKAREKYVRLVRERIGLIEGAQERRA